MASLISCPLALAQTQPFALPVHKGAMLLDLKDFRVTQSSAKPKGNELGIQAHDDGHMEMLAFLFLTPENTSQTAASCRQAELDAITKNSGGKLKLQSLDPDKKDTKDVATVSLMYPGGEHLYQYNGSGDQCLSIEVYPDKGSALNHARASAFLAQQRYDPGYVPTGKDKFIYAGVLYGGGQIKASIPHL
jgi:hypothetical protein